MAIVLRKRKSPGSTHAGGKAKKSHISHDKQNSTARNPANSSHQADSKQMLEPSVSLSKEDFRGQPPVWAQGRADLCNTLTWFRSHQGGSYTIDKKCHGFLLDGHGGGSRDYIDDEIVITRAGGGCKVDENGNLQQLKNQDESTRVVESLRASKTSGIAVGLIIGERNNTIWRKVPHRYNVMDWFRVVDVWFEKTENGKFGARVRFQKLDLDKPSWWAREGSEVPLPLSQRNLIKPKSKICSTCGESSILTYEQGWMCLQGKCEAAGRLENGLRPTNLTYDPTFLSYREPPDDNIRPHFSLVPGLPNTMADPDVWTSRDAWRGVVCPACNKCISRKRWNGWICSDPLDTDPVHQDTCLWKKILKIPSISIQSLLESGVTERSCRADEAALVRPDIRSTDAYDIAAYSIDEVGRIVHFIAKSSTLQRPNGPDDIFRRLQQADLGLCRFPFNVMGVSRQLTSHFAANFGMPYKYVVPVHSRPFTEAPAEIMFALGRLTWAAKYVVGREAKCLNEMLTIGYFEKMSIGYHDDGEDSLGPTIATLSLGAKATMKFRLKDQYFRGKGRMSKAPVADDAVLPGCDNFEKRKELKKQHDLGLLDDAEYSEKRLELAEVVKQRESKPLISLDLNHGDLVVMDGPLLQKYYEHSVASKGKLRFALTARHVLDDHVTMEERAKGQYVLAADQIYDGK